MNLIDDLKAKSYLNSNIEIHKLTEKVIEKVKENI